MKTAAQETTEYIHQLKELLHQSSIIRDEIQHHLQLNKLQDRIGGIKQQLQFIRCYVTPTTPQEKAKYFKHNRLALQLINHHLGELEKEGPLTQFKKNKADDEQWRLIEELRDEILHNLENSEALLQHIALSQEDMLHTNKNMLLYQLDVANLAEKTEWLLKAIRSKAPLLGAIFEEIHHLYHELQFIKLHAYSRNPAYGPQQQFLNSHMVSFNQINTQLHQLHHRWGGLLNQLNASHRHEQAELAEIHEEIEHTILQFEEKIREIENNKISHNPNLN